MFASLLLLPVAFAQDTAPAPAPAAEPAPAAPPKTRKNMMEVGVRGKYMFLPDSILDIPYNKHDGDGYPTRPDIAAYAVGLEYVLDGGSSNGIFYVEYIGSLAEAGYWDDRDTPEDPEDGSWIDPGTVGMIAVGADYAGEIRATDWFSVMVGGGLGVGIVTAADQIRQWTPNDDIHDVTDPDCGVGVPAYDRADPSSYGCADDGSLEVPPVLPIVDVNLALKFNINERASIRLEGGLHDLVYGGAAVGVRF